MRLINFIIIQYQRTKFAILRQRTGLRYAKRFIQLKSLCIIFVWKKNENVFCCTEILDSKK